MTAEWRIGRGMCRGRGILVGRTGEGRCRRTLLCLAAAAPTIAGWTRAVVRPSVNLSFDSRRSRSAVFPHCRATFFPPRSRPSGSGGSGSSTLTQGGRSRAWPTF